MIPLIIYILCRTVSRNIYLRGSAKGDSPNRRSGLQRSDRLGLFIIYSKPPMPRKRSTSVGPILAAALHSVAAGGRQRAAAKAQRAHETAWHQVALPLLAVAGFELASQGVWRWAAAPGAAAAAAGWSPRALSAALLAVYALALLGTPRVVRANGPAILLDVAALLASLARCALFVAGAPRGMDELSACAVALAGGEALPLDARVCSSPGDAFAAATFGATLLLLVLRWVHTKQSVRRVQWSDTQCFTEFAPRIRTGDVLLHTSYDLTCTMIKFFTDS